MKDALAIAGVVLLAVLAFAGVVALFVAIWLIPMTLLAVLVWWLNGQFHWLPLWGFWHFEAAAVAGTLVIGILSRLFSNKSVVEIKGRV